ncbi:COMPASS (Complex proteins associated with s.t1.c1p) component shg1 domain-containing protein [Apiospora saccharicola]|uniref:COMPASS (Complex proteins associated with s.t1.c1p) component shg1 domain-containing protein n=1 Tax=Apiospora saccharicola TaxID=335842 RepID=A0ABR1TLY6_9PEZI
MAASTEQTPAAATVTAPAAARKFKASDLPLTSATRSAIEGLAHSFKKKGGYDAIRKQVWEQFEASDYEKQVTKSILEVAEKEVDRNPSQLLSLDRRKAAALIDGALDRSGVYQKAEEVIDQLIDAKAIEERIRDLRKAEIGEEAALAEQQRGAKTDQDYAEEASQKLAEREKLRRELKEKEEQILEEKRKIEREERKKREREQEKLEAKRVEEREARRKEREAKEAEREKQRQKERDERRAAREKEREERDKEREKEREARRLERTRENADRDKDQDRSKDRTKDRPREKSRDRSRHRDRERERDRDRRNRTRSPRRRDSRERRRRDSSRPPKDTKDKRRTEEPKKQLSKEELERIERDALADLLRESNGNTEKAPEVEIDEALAPPPRRVKAASAIQPLRRDSPKTAVEGKRVPELTKSDSKDSVHPSKDASQIPAESKEAKEVKKEIKIDIKGLKEPLPAKDTKSHSDSKEAKEPKDAKVSRSTDDRRGSIATSTQNRVGHTLGLSDEIGKEVGQGTALTRTAEIAENPAVHANDSPSRITIVQGRIEIVVGTGAVLALVVALSAKGMEAAPNFDGKGAGLGIEQRLRNVAGLGLVKNATSRRGSPAVPRRVPRDARDLGRPVLALKGKTEVARECERIAASEVAP